MTGNAAWLLACRVAADLLNLLLFVLISRQFGPEGTGMYAYGFAIASFLFAATTMGVEEYAIREYTRADAARRPRLLQDVLGTQLCVAALALLGLALYVLATKPDVPTLISILALTTYQFGNAIAATWFVPAMAEQQMMQPAVSFLASRSLAFIFAGVLILIAHCSLPTALTAFATSGIIILFLSARSAKAHGQILGIHVSIDALRARTGAMWSFASIDLLGQVLSRIGVVALKLLEGGAAAGVYATGLKLIEAAYLTLHFIGAAAYPRLCRSFHDDPRDFRRLGMRLLVFSMAVAALIAACMYWIVPHLLVPIFGPHYAGTQAVIASMAILAFAQSAEVIPGRILLAANLHVERAAMVAAAAVLCAVLNFALVPQWGIHAANFSTTAAYIVLCLLYARTLHARSGRQQSVRTVLKEWL